jgi:hypothetical protein
MSACDRTRLQRKERVLKIFTRVSIHPRDPFPANRVFGGTNRFRGNPAVLGIAPLDRWLCVLAFRRVCPLAPAFMFTQPLDPSQAQESLSTDIVGSICENLRCLDGLMSYTSIRDFTAGKFGGLELRTYLIIDREPRCRSDDREGGVEPPRQGHPLAKARNELLGRQRGNPRKIEDFLKWDRANFPQYGVAPPLSTTSTQRSSRLVLRKIRLGRGRDR